MSVDVVRVALIVVFVLGAFVGAWVRGQWRGKRTRLVRVPWPVVRLGPRQLPAAAPPAGARAEPRIDLGWVRTAVYLYLDRGGRLLYVGLAANPEKRAGQHAGLETEPMKAWWPAVDTVEAWWFHDRYVACAVEWFAIKYLRPLHNVAPGGPDDAYTHDRPDITPARFRLPSSIEARARRTLRRSA